MPASCARYLVCVIAENAATAAAFFRRLPEEWRDRSDVHFAVFVRQPATDLQALSCELTDLHVSHTHLIPVSEHDGYGRLSKLGLRVAIDRGYDAALIVPADDAAPLALVDLVQTLVETDADVVVSSRVSRVREAHHPHQSEEVSLADSTHPTQEQNWITRCLNTATGRDWLDYASPCRAYTTEFLQQVPFELNADDELFAVEILLQAAHVQARVGFASVSPPCEAQGLQPLGFVATARVLAAAVQYRLHHHGMWCTLKLRRLGVERYQDKTAAPYTTHALAVAEVARRQARNVLDIGCGPGYVAAACAKAGAEVTGVDACETPRQPVSRFHRVDLERDAVPCSPWDFDVTLLLDVIEHLADPERFLLSLRNVPAESPASDAGALLILSTPNVAFASVRLGLLLGRFNYAERGILDITHKRLFTRSSLLRLLADCGYDVESCRAVGAPFPAVMPGRLGRVLGWLSDGLARLWPSLFAFQFFVIARPRPGVDQLWRQATVVQAPVADAECLVPSPPFRWGRGLG